MPKRIPLAKVLLALAIVFWLIPLQGLADNRLTRQEAAALVKQLPPVKQELAKRSPPRKLVFDDEEPQRFVFRLVLFLPGTGGDPPRSTCIGWYAVDKQTRRAYGFTPGME